jgi:hypothetical protein
MGFYSCVPFYLVQQSVEQQHKPTGQLKVNFLHKQRPGHLHPTPQCHQNAKPDCSSSASAATYQLS